MSQKRGHSPDFVFLSCLFVLVVFGLVMLSSASFDLGKIEYGETFYFLKKQIFQGLSLGIIGFLFAFFLPYEFWKKLAVPLFALSVAGLILILTTNLGISRGGATRWLDLGFFSFQPAELLKLTFIIYLAAWLSSKKAVDAARQKSWLYGFIPFMAISGIIGFLMFKQPATTTPAIILAAGLIVYFASGARMSFVIGPILAGLTFIILFISLSQGYRAERIRTYVKTAFSETKTEQIDLDNDFHIDRAKTAISAGGFWGIGFGKSTIKYNSLPEAIGDSIFVVIAEELGFLGASLTIAAFVVLIARGFLIAKNSKDKFAQLVVIGIISVIAIQAFIHIGAMSGVVPLTGISLPFISYGGTSLAIFLTMAGLVAKISRYAS